MSDDLELLRRVYALFNGRDIESVLAAMHPDVVWANGMEGGHVYGRDEVRSYWKRQWAVGELSFGRFASVLSSKQLAAVSKFRVPPRS
jgi:hypothetical protein